MIGLLGIGLGLYGLYELKENVKYTKKDTKIQTGTGTIAEQKIKIDRDFIDILEYSGAKCTIKNNRVVDVVPHQYGGMELYLMQKGYSQEAINYCKRKFDDFANKQQSRQLSKARSFTDEVENALKYKSSREVSVFFRVNGYAHPYQIEKDNKRIIDYLHTHNNPKARANVIVGGTSPNYDFDE